MAEETLRLRFETSPQLVLHGMGAAGRAVSRTMPFRRKAFQVLQMALAMLAVIVAGAVVGHLVGVEGHLPSLLVGLVAGGLAVGVFYGTMMQYIAEVTAEAQARRGPVELVLDDLGLREITGSAEVRAPWRDVEEVLDMTGGLAIRFGALCIAIPETALPAGLDRAGLRALIDRRREAA